MQTGWNYIVLIACLLLSFFAIYKELKRNNRAHLALRIVASLVAIAALAAVALPLTYNSTDTETTDSSALLITNGANPDSLKAYARAKQYVIDPALQKLFPKAKLIDIAILNTDTPAIGQLHVFGYGLSKQELEQLGGIKVSFHPTAAPAGFTAINWIGQLQTGEQLQVQGSFTNTTGKAVKLVLSELNTGMDSMMVTPNTSIPFELNAKPKHPGRALFTLYVIADKDTLVSEKLPVEITTVKPISVLMLSASPDFEDKFLKDWLAGNGYSVASRAAISKNKYSQDYVNMPKLDLTHINTAQLGKFDVVIGDLSTLKGLNPGESNALKQEVTEKGLGLIIRADSAGKTGSWLQTDFPVEYQSVKTVVPMALVLQGSATKTAKLNIDPAYLNSRPATQQLISDEQNHVLASAAQAGTGKLIFTTLNNTYSWMLGGNKDDYTTLWTLLINKAVKKAFATERWSTGDDIATIGQPVQLKLEKASMPSQIIANQILLAPAQNPLIAFEWIGDYRPGQAGWQQVKQANGLPKWWYAWQPADWQTIRATQKLSATKHYLQGNGQSKSVTKQIQQKHRHPIPKMYFYILFLVACTYLWVENKFA